jgi:hypothetical protein
MSHPPLEDVALAKLAKEIAPRIAERLADELSGVAPL